MLVDNLVITVKAGNGGNGAATLRRNGQTAKGGPDGGHGGNGGSVYVQGDAGLNDLRQFRYKKTIAAERGVDGARQNMDGRNGQDLTVYLPVGTRITDQESGTIQEITDGATRMLFAMGGRGGRGNTAFKSSTIQTPRYAEKGGAGQIRQVRLELRLIAEIGLIGLPNAGKSSLLSVLTNARPAIGAYPFTTLEPNIGMLGNHAIADIPGLIEGAAEGKGLGTSFLKHIEKTKILVHCIDVSAPKPMEAYDTVRKEFEKYSALLAAKPEVILLNKTDLVEPTVVKTVKKQFEKLGKTVLTSSVYEEQSLTELQKVLLSLLKR